MSKTLTIAALVAAFLTGSCTTIGPAKINNAENVITYRMSSKSSFSFETVDPLLNALQKAEVELGSSGTFEVIITSPGGTVISYKTLLHRISLSSMHIRTVVHTEALSAAALTFILGDERVMEEDAEIMFHYARVSRRGVTITEDGIRKYLENTPSIPKEGEKDTRTPLEKVLSEVDHADLISLYASLTSANRFIYQVVEARLGAEVANKVLKQGEDIYLTGKEALDLGIATRIYKIKVK